VCNDDTHLKIMEAITISFLQRIKFGLRYLMVKTSFNLMNQLISFVPILLIA
jgi:hypothetical protein